MKLFKKIFKGNTLYYPGCMTKFVLKDLMANYQKVLEKEGIEYIMLKDKELCCGSPLKNAGMKDQLKESAQKNLEIFKQHGVDRIISNCPGCVAVLKNEYKKLLGDSWDMEVLHMAEVITEKSITAKAAKEIATYHDSCHLGRGLGIFEKPRKIIEKSGYTIKEMELSREKSYCCGAGGGVKSNNPALANRVATDRIAQAKKTSAKKLFTFCPMCYANLKENSDTLEVQEISELIK